MEVQKAFGPERVLTYMGGMPRYMYIVKNPYKRPAFQLEWHQSLSLHQTLRSDPTNNLSGTFVS